MARASIETQVNTAGSTTNCLFFLEGAERGMEWDVEWGVTLSISGFDLEEIVFIISQGGCFSSVCLCMAGYLDSFSQSFYFFYSFKYFFNLWHLFTTCKGSLQAQKWKRGNDQIGIFQNQKKRIN